MNSRGAAEREVIVIGGGPAGSTAATLLARQGRDVLLLERERFPRFHIGESLMPATWWTLERLGFLDRMHGSPFLRKHSVQFFLKDGRATTPFYFADVDPHESSVTWQVDRAEFDRMLLEHAAASGAEVRQPVTVLDVLFDGERAVGVRAAADGGGAEEIRARAIVDASGQSALLSRRLGLKEIDPNLRNAAVFTRYRGAIRDPGIDAGAILVLRTRNGDSWFWFIPLPGEITSIGVVGSLEYLIVNRPPDPLRVLEEEIALCPALQARIRNAERLDWVRVLMDFTYVSRRMAGDGWIMAGDAFGFLDPIYSSGVLLALKAGEFAADAVGGAFATGDFSAASLGRFGPRFIAGMEALRRVVYAFYSRDFSFARFLRNYPECRDEVVHLLSGNVFRRPVDRLLLALEREMPVPGYRPLALPGDRA
jgi:flavin-dependent dehydrogenase